MTQPLSPPSPARRSFPARRFAYGAVPLALLMAATTGLSAHAAGGSGGADASATTTTTTTSDACDPRRPGLDILQVWFPRSDVNENNRVTRREFTADATTSFRTWDVAPRDGVLRGDEVTRAATEAADLLRLEAERPNYLCLQTDPPAGTTSGGGGAPDLIAAIDRNVDGAVTSGEWDAGTRDRFGAIDCNDDRTIVAREAFLFGRQEPCPSRRS